MTYKQIAEKTGTSVEAVRELMGRARVVSVSVAPRFRVKRWAVPYEGVDARFLAMGEGQTKAEAVIAALSKRASD